MSETCTYRLAYVRAFDLNAAILLSYIINRLEAINSEEVILNLDELMADTGLTEGYIRSARLRLTGILLTKRCKVIEAKKRLIFAVDFQRLAKNVEEELMNEEPFCKIHNLHNVKCADTYLTESVTTTTLVNDFEEEGFQTTLAEVEEPDEKLASDSTKTKNALSVVDRSDESMRSKQAIAPLSEYVALIKKIFILDDEDFVAGNQFDNCVFALWHEGIAKELILIALQQLQKKSERGDYPVSPVTLLAFARRLNQQGGHHQTKTIKTTNSSNQKRFQTLDISNL